ncbi:hypothetical protein FBU30_008756 [Linnemannia zychae]|nr:hypothetical protein FBU30_008756 [Linnemannia zychae]
MSTYGLKKETGKLSDMNMNDYNDIQAERDTQNVPTDKDDMLLPEKPCTDSSSPSTTVLTAETETDAQQSTLLVKQQNSACSSGKAIPPISALSVPPLSPSPPLRLLLTAEGYTNISDDHPITGRHNASSLVTSPTSPIPDGALASPISLTSGSASSRSRLWHLPAALSGTSEPPAYVEQYPLQSITPSPYETRPSSFSSSTRQQQRPYRGSLSFVPEPIGTTAAALSGGVSTGSHLSPSSPIPTSASINLSLSAPYRRPFLEEDELPDYISLTESALPFKIPSAQSITYRVSVTQGPAEFQQQEIQQSDQISSTNPEPTESTQGQQIQSSDAIMSEEIAHNSAAPVNNSGTENEVEIGRQSNVVASQENRSRQDGGAWTMEYWVGDTILYLCYLMDPKTSTTTGLVPRTRPTYITNTRNSNWTTESNRFSLANVIRSHIRSNSQNDTPNTSTMTTTATTATIVTSTQGEQQISDVVTIDMTQANARSSATNQEAGTSNTAVNDDDEERERVPTGHLRGGPPPISRTRYNTARTLYAPQHMPNRAIGFRGLRNAFSRSSGPYLSTAAFDATTSQSQDTRRSSSSNFSESRSTDDVQNSASRSVATAPASSTHETPEQSAVMTLAMPVETGPLPEGAQENSDVTVPEPLSSTGHTGPLPNVGHIRINDGYEGEEQDAIMAHTLARTGIQGDRPDNHSNSPFNSALTSEFFKVPSFAFVSAEDPQTWLWWSTHHVNNLQRCQQEGPNEEVLMWWRSRFDEDALASKKRRSQIKKEQRMGTRPIEKINFKERWRRFRTLKSAIPYRESMEITMRVRGLYYAWREEAFTPGEVMDDIQISPTNPSRYFILVRDDSLVMGQRIKGGPVAEVVIHGIDASNPLLSTDNGGVDNTTGAGSAPPFTGGESTHVTETLDAPPYGHIPSIRSDGSSVTSNNGNTFMTEVSAATGGPIRSTVASTFMHLPPHGRRRSGSSSVQFHPSDPETPAPTIGDGRQGSLAPSEPASLVSVLSLGESSSFSTSLRKRKCTIRILEGINSEVETFALSTGPRLPELFDLFTDQSVPGPSRATFICSQSKALKSTMGLVLGIGTWAKREGASYPTSVKGSDRDGGKDTFLLILQPKSRSPSVYYTWGNMFIHF